MAKYVAPTRLSTVDLGVKDEDVTEERDMEQLERVAKEISIAFSDTGCALLKNHGLKEDLWSDVIEAKKKFFALNDDVKKQYISADGTLLGYLPFNKARYDSSTQDLHEGYIIVSEDEDILPDALVPSLLPAAAKAMAAFRVLAFKLMKALSLALGQEQDYLSKMHQELTAKKGFSCLRVNHFPPILADLPPNYIRFGAHIDHGTMSLLVTGEEGLQICDRDGTWIDIPPNNLFVMAGQFLHCHSHKKFIAPVHRVVIPDKGSREVPRFSLIFFACPDTHLPIRPPCPEDPEPPSWNDYYSSRVNAVLKEKYQKKEQPI